jgi:hypothetical protein
MERWSNSAVGKITRGAKSRCCSFRNAHRFPADGHDQKLEEFSEIGLQMKKTDRTLAVSFGGLPQRGPNRIWIGTLSASYFKENAHEYRDVGCSGTDQKETHFSRVEHSHPTPSLNLRFQNSWR